MDLIVGEEADKIKKASHSKRKKEKKKKEKEKENAKQLKQYK